MSTANNGKSQDIIKQVQAYIQGHAKKEEVNLLEVFAQRYLGVCALEDLQQFSVPSLYTIVQSVWDFMSVRAPNEAKIRIFNPEEWPGEWASTHTIVEISHDDAPFLVDSTRMALNRHGYQIHFIIHIGGLKVLRDSENRITKVFANGEAEKNALPEAPIYIEIDRIVDEKKREELKEDIDRALSEVRAAVSDWPQMVQRVKDCLRQLETCPPGVDEADFKESRYFLEWLIDNHFTFLGARDYKLIGNENNRALQVIPGSGLGVLRDKTSNTRAKAYAELPPQARKMALSKNILIVAKTNTRPMVHREAWQGGDYVGVKYFDKNGELIGEHRFIGLYTSTAYHSSPKNIPFLRHKVAKVIENLGFPADSHDGKEAAHILDTLPRDDVFQATYEELLDLTLAIIQMKERKRVRLLVRRDAYYRYFSCLVFVPREIFTTDLAVAMQSILMDAFKGLECTFTTYFSESVLARIHYHIRVNPKTAIEYDIVDIEKQLVIVSRSWADELKKELIAACGEAEGLSLWAKYQRVFPGSYTESYPPYQAIDDIKKMEGLSADNPLDMSFVQAGVENAISLKLFHAEHTMILSDILPILENMGLKVIGEHPHEIKFKNGTCIWINDFDMSYAVNKALDVRDIKDIFQEAFTKAWFGQAENDGFNRLVLEANLTWQETAMLRAYTKYLKQIGFTFSQSYIEKALVNNADITKALVQLFILRFDKACQMNGQSNPADIIAYIEKKLEEVVSLDEATMRTNYFQQDEKGASKSYISFKFDPALVSDLPLPRPKFEIFVYSPRVEGVHLRAGKVARGGLRWSDRREDFRTEVLGLMKAQQVKNTVIVPEGAKGGFVLKCHASDMSRDDYFKEGIACYSIFISGLLDITDNIVDGVVVPPVNVVRYDEDDPYLVVAADKGTATFSDIANGIAQRYGFWLDDAFASGGSAGYDHKKMGITSRGVWVSVKRHFRELGINPDTDDFTVVGIGDMAGDVFGNGMLLSKHTKLIGAFNHMHIFLDPDPDPAASYVERQRLFNLPRSSWSDYNASLISPGGGVFNRSAKSIKLSPEIMRALNTDKETMMPNELIRTMLCAPVDLIWNGGIGTFVKSTQELNLNVGDRTNDSIRVDAVELKAKTIAEGGNLGLTQLARIEYSLHGGIVNTDFIDNSAGVDCSDHEVNMKILLNRFIADGSMTREERNKFLEALTDEVAALVLMDNYDQTQMLSLETSVAQQTIDLFRQFMNELEKNNQLNRELEYLPDDKTLLERKANNKPMTRPEIAILLAYSKMYLKQSILSSDIPEDPYFEKYLLTAFPKEMGEKYFDAMKEHSLRREIISTQLCKSVTDRMGINFVERLQRETGASTAFVVRAYVIAKNIFHSEERWNEIVSLDKTVELQVQYRMMLHMYFLIRRATRWMLRNRKPTLNIQETINEFETNIAMLYERFSELLDSHEREAFHAAASSFTDHGVPEKLATHIAACNAMFTSLDIIESSRKYELDVCEVAKTYYLLGNRLELNFLRDLMASYPVENQWEELARAGFRDDLDRVQRKLCVRVLSLKSKDVKNKPMEERVDYWINKHLFLVERWQKLLSDVKSSDMAGFVTYSVVLRELFDFAQAA